MFQTEIVYFFQSFTNPILTKLMVIITSLGYEDFLTIFLLTFIFGINFRKGFYLIHVILITGIITEYLKYLVAYPRPYAVDSNVKILAGNIQNKSHFLQKGAKGFFQFLPSDVVNYYRSIKNASFGIPSGHTSTAVVLWGSIFVLFKNKVVRIFAAILIILIPLSRIYLGMHFLADVIAGYILGSIILFIFYKLSFQYDFFYSISFSKILFKRLIPVIYLVGLPILLQIFIPDRNPELQGALLGFNITFILLKISGLPTLYNKVIKRIGNVLLAFFVFSLVSILIFSIISFFALNQSSIFTFFKFTLIIFTGFYISIILSLKFGLMKRHL